MPNVVPHIAILCSRLDLPGGIERAVVNTVNLFAKKNNSVTLIILDETANSFYKIHPSIKIIHQKLSFGITPEGNILSRKIKLLSDVLQLRKIIKKIKPDILISSEYPFSVAAVLSRSSKKLKVYSWEHHHHNWLQKNKFWTFLCQQAYPKLHGIICLNRAEADYYKSITKTYIIPNFLSTENQVVARCKNKIILSVGWLIPRKGIDLMLQTAKEILKKNPGWQWKLIGRGKLQSTVENFITNENLESQFILQVPENESISHEYANASIFVLSSRYEAFPMVLLEAMQSGLPCVSFDCPSGPSDIITQDADGLLVEKENTDQLMEAIQQLIDNDAKRIRMGENASQNIQRFSAEAVYKIWEESILLHQ